MFDGIAGRYDRMNRLMTLGQDQKWRRLVVQKAGQPEGGKVLDLATGTGDIAALLKKTYPDADVYAGDFSSNMLKEAQRRFSGSTIHWLSCDANAIPFADETFTAVTFGYLLRNVDDPARVLAEVYRVLQPGGRIVCLDTTPPEKNFFYPFIRFYFRFGIPVLGKMVARDEAAYNYLTGSTMDFYSADELAELFIKAGFRDVSCKKFMFGTIGVHWGAK